MLLGLHSFILGTDDGFDQGWPMLIAYDDPSEDAHRHPFWVFDWSQLHGPQVFFCTFVLMLAGILCSAGGIGGGGVYVTVLMVAGGLSPRDAVPLSKAIVFFGSISSLVLNMRKSASTSSSQGLIDYNICRLVVPSALVGTLVGVFLNRHTSDWVLVSILSCILIFMTYMTIRTAHSQYQEEEAKATIPAQSTLEAGTGTVGSGFSGTSVLQLSSVDAGKHDSRTQLSQMQAEMIEDLCKAAKPKSFARSLTWQDGVLSLGTLIVVVVCGVLRFHAGACSLAVTGPLPHGSTWKTCHHPSVRVIGDSLEQWMASSVVSQSVLFAAMAVPACACACVMIHYGRTCIIQEAWDSIDVFKYELMALSTGCLAGLVGIGGGLIFSPFFLLMGVDPSVAVATSSTCVIFTSSSTTLQYLLTDRIMMSLTLIYGAVNLLASYLGTSLVHMLSDRFAARKSYITSIVAVGVLISAILSVVKLFSDGMAVNAH